MMLVMTLLVRDEQDILATNIDYHLAQGVDLLIITDNLSSDSTPDIIARYVNRGKAVLIREDRDDYSQAEWVTRMARMACADFHADWVINNDADEFWWPSGRDNLKEALASIPDAFGAARAFRANFIPTSYLASSNFWNEMTVRDCASVNALGAPLPVKVCHRAAPDIEVSHGNHDALLAGSRLATADAPIEILHFPLRGFDQFARKISLGGSAYARNPTLDPSVGSTWRFLHEKQRRGALRSYYEDQVLDDAALAAGLASGRLQRDYRLRDFLQTVRDAP